MSKNKISREKSIRRTKTVTEIFVCAVFLLATGYVVKSGADNMRTVTQSQYVDVSGQQDIQLPDTTQPIDPDKVIFTYAPVNTRDKFTGDLILVNNQHEYFSTGEENLVSIMTRNDETGRNCFTAVDYTYTILEPVYEPMAQLIEDFYDIYEDDTLIIYGSYRTKEFQQQLYDNFTASEQGDDAPIVAKPGFSEHETGYAFDFSEIINYDYQGTGNFEWLNKNGYKYGFIIRYPEDKEDITEFRYEPWHFRYVGIPHATYMTENNLCLEEYIDLLRSNYPYDGEHLEFTAEGADYEVFFFASDDSSDVTNVPVPTGYKYDISGNNIDGFIVTVHKSEKVALGEENPEMNTTESDEIPEETEADTDFAE
ncbi:MAG: M15 family metallopeptidase [Ruminococcus flavefaciens]|nr:M15 family metallopeptidase [Ruminococcus flavefaciens]MCM1229482.1 M15 family metallopeptidase [Ruminococcus flavefaciens]